jgi:hypothetical protein
MADPPIIQLPAAGADAAAHQTALAAPALASSTSLLQLVQHDAVRDVWQVRLSLCLLQAVPGSPSPAACLHVHRQSRFRSGWLLPTVLTQCMADSIQQASWAQQIARLLHTRAG